MAAARSENPGGAPELRFHPDHTVPGAGVPVHAERLYELIGREAGLAEVERALRMYVQDQRPPVVGAMLVTCSDEAEYECAQTFERYFGRYLLPSQKFFAKAVFRVANLGGRYEWGSVRIAESHYGLAKGADKWKLMVVKVNAHVSVERTSEGVQFGRMQRYESQSVYCGALDALLEGASLPFTEDLGDAFGFEGVERLSVLRDPGRIDPSQRNLLAAVVSARLQARRAMIDIQDYEASTPTLYVVLPCVTLNRREHDTEILCGIYTADRRDSEPHDEYCGLGDRPEHYRLSSDGDTIVIEDAKSFDPRRSRNHRELVLSTWRAGERKASPSHPQLASELREALQKTKDHSYAGVALKSSIVLAAQVAPVPVALLLFGEGLVGIHHTARAHRLARAAAGDELALQMLRDIHQGVGELPPEQALHLLRLLADEYGG